MPSNQHKPPTTLLELVVPGKENSFRGIQETNCDSEGSDELTICEAEEFFEISAEIIYQGIL